MVFDPGQAIHELAQASSAERTERARQALEQARHWADWRDAFNSIYTEDPRLGVLAAGALAEAARSAGNSGLAGRFRVVYGLAHQRAGSMQAASEAFLRVEQALREEDPVWSVIAQVYAVDALAHAGLLDEALAAARAAAGRMRAPVPARFRAVLQVNHANALRLAGRLQEAIALFERAARAFARRGLEGNAVVARMNAGVARMYAGDVRGGRRRFQASAEAFEALGQPDRMHEARYNEAWSFLFDGQVAQGIRELERMAARFADQEAARREGLCRMDLAGGLLRVGDFESAADQATASVACFERAGARAEALEASLLCAGAGERPGTALEQLAREADAMGRRDLALRAQVLAFERDLEHQRAVDLRAVRRVRMRAERIGQQHLVALLDLVRGEQLLRRGRLEAAQAAFCAPSTRRPGLLWLGIAAETGRARCQARLGDTRGALARLARILRRLDTLRIALPGAWLRASFVLNHLDPFLARVEILLARGTPADRRQAESLLDAMAARQFVEGWERAPSSARADRLRRRLETIYDQLAGGAGGARGPLPPRGRLEHEAREIETGLATLWRSEERRAGGRRGHAVSRPVSLTAAAGVAALHVWSANGVVHGIARCGAHVGSAHEIGALSTVEALSVELGFHVRRCQQLASPAAIRAAEDVIHALSLRFLRPLEELPAFERLRIVRGAGVPDVPFEVMRWAGGMLAERVEFLRVPAVALRRTSVPLAQGRAVLALGEEDLRGVAAELAHLAPGADVFSGANASCAEMARCLQTRRVVHLAGHGLHSGQIPPLGGVRMADGWFAAADVPASVSAEVVVLAACRTHEGTGRPFAAWGGLPRALLRRGARHVVWTAGDVDDAVTADFVQRFHDELEQHEAPRAFGRALEFTRAAHRHIVGLVQFRLSGLNQ